MDVEVCFNCVVNPKENKNKNVYIGEPKQILRQVVYSACIGSPAKGEGNEKFIKTTADIIQKKMTIRPITPKIWGNI